MYEKHHHGKLEHHQQLAGLAEEAIEANQEKLKQLETALPTEQEFYELIDSHLLNLLKEDDILKLDAICKELVTNLRAGNDSVPVIKLNPPYNLLVDLSEISNGRDTPMLLELFDYIIGEPEVSAELIRDLQEIFSPKNKLELTQPKAR